MSFQIDIWLRGDNHATTEVIAPVEREPRAWTDTDVAAVLTAMLRAMDKAKNPDAAADRPVALRGFSWIVNPFETGGVVIALEMTLGAVVAGPFDIPEAQLTRMISRVMASNPPAARDPTLYIKRAGNAGEALPAGQQVQPTVGMRVPAEEGC